MEEYVDIRLRRRPLRMLRRRGFHLFKKRTFWGIGLLVVLLAISFELGRYSVSSAYQGFAGQSQASKTLAQVGKLIALPTGETPQMATITNAASAKQGQPFLRDAQDGDIIIVYQKAKEAILFRPSEDKLINVGPVNDQAPVSSAAQQSAVPTIANIATTSNATTTRKK